MRAVDSGLERKMIWVNIKKNNWTFPKLIINNSLFLILVHSYCLTVIIIIMILVYFWRTWLLWFMMVPSAPSMMVWVSPEAKCCCPFSSVITSCTVSAFVSFFFLAEGGVAGVRLSLRCVRCSRLRWSLRSMWDAKERQQWRQRKGSSPVWVNRWCFRPIGTLNTVSHSGQTLFFGLPSSSTLSKKTWKSYEQQNFLLVNHFF